MLLPLVQFVCDSCGGTIEPGHGRLEWLEHDHVARSLRIVHHGESCQSPPQQQGRRELPLDDFAGPDKLASLYGFISVAPNGENTATPEHQEEFTEILRRLTMPYYEEARLYWNKAMTDGFFGSASDAQIYSSTSCKALVQSYAANEGRAEGRAGGGCGGGGCSC